MADQPDIDLEKVGNVLVRNGMPATAVLVAEIVSEVGRQLAARFDAAAANYYGDDGLVAAQSVREWTGAS